MPATVGIFDPVNSADVRMIQRRENPGFALEPADALGVADKMWGEDLDRHIEDFPAGGLC